MNLRTRTFPLLLAAAFIAGASVTLPAVIDVRLPLGRIYVQSKSVFTAEITGIHAEAKIVEAKTGSAYKATPPAAEVKLQVREPAALLTDLAAKGASKTIVVFEGVRTSAIHIGDHAYTATPGGRPGTYIIISRNKDLDGAFTGTTAALVKEVEKLQQQAKEGPATGPATAPGASTSPAK